MKVLMFGWEFPPYFAGGVGTVCGQLTKALAEKNVDITFIMPKGPNIVKSNHVNLLVADNLIPHSKIKFKSIKSSLKAYQSFSDYDQSILTLSNELLTKNTSSNGNIYGENLLTEIYRFAEKARIIVEKEEFDVIHAHDWVTFPAAIIAAKISGKPLITHMHITEFDKTGGLHADPRVYAIEKEGMEKSDVVIAVSNKIKKRITDQYFIPEEKIKVVYNGAEFYTRAGKNDINHIKGDNKLVLYLGRVTLQKGPDYFIEAAKKILLHHPKTKFVLAGSGDMLQSSIKRVAELGMINNFMFPGFVDRVEGDKLFQLADLFILPSVSEPFGITPLEAMYNDTPVMVSNQSGVSEVLTNCLKTDFWDVDDIAAKATAALSYSVLNNYMKQEGKKEVLTFSWEKPAKQCMNIYREAQNNKRIAW